MCAPRPRNPEAVPVHGLSLGSRGSREAQRHLGVGARATGLAVRTHPTRAMRTTRLAIPAVPGQGLAKVDVSPLRAGTARAVRPRIDCCKWSQRQRRMPAECRSLTGALAPIAQADGARGAIRLERQKPRRTATSRSSPPGRRAPLIMTSSPRTPTVAPAGPRRAMRANRRRCWRRVWFTRLRVGLSGRTPITRRSPRRRRTRSDRRHHPGPRCDQRTQACDRSAYVARPPNPRLRANLRCRPSQFAPHATGFGANWMSGDGGN